MKKAFESGDKNLWLKPIPIETYLELCEDEHFVQDGDKDFFLRTTVENLGNTILDVPDIFGETEVALVPHVKYSYPILHQHAYVEIIYVAFGSCRHFIDDAEFEMTEGDLCIVPPGRMHAISVTDDDTFVLNILASKKMFNRYFMDLLRGDYLLVDFFEKILNGESVSNYILFRTGDDCWMQNTVLEMCKEFHRKSYAYEKAIALYIELLFLHIVRNYEMMAVVSDEKSLPQNSHVVALLGYLSVNYATVTLGSAADFFGYTPAYLSKLVKRYTGRRFTEIVTELQMKNASQFMDNGETNLTEIAQKVGCFDSSHFTKKFKAHFGITPTEYIRKNTAPQ